MKNDLITKGDAVKAVLDWMDQHKSETIHKQDIAEIIMQLPKEEPSYDDIREYCRRRCLTIMTNELFIELAKRYSTIAQPEIIRCKDCKYYEIGWLKADGSDDKRYKPSVCVNGKYGINRKPDWFCADAERKENG